MFVRSPFKFLNIKNEYKFSSIKNNGTVICKNELQFSCCYFLDFNQNIERFEANPDEIIYYYDGKKYTHKPSFLAHFKDGNQRFIEVVLIDGLENDDVKAYLKATVNTAKLKNTPTLIVTDEQINHQVLLENLKSLHKSKIHTKFNQLNKFLHGTVNTKLNQLQKLILESISNKKTCLINEINLPFDIDQSLLIDNCLLLISSNHINADIYSSKIDGDTRVGVNGNNNFLAVTLYDEYDKFFTDEISETKNLPLVGNETDETNNQNSLKNITSDVDDDYLLENNLDEFYVEPITESSLSCDEVIRHLNHDVTNEAEEFKNENVEDISNIPEILINEGIERYKLYRLIDRDLKGGWTQKNLEPLIDLHISSVALRKPSWRTLARWHKMYLESNGDLNIFIKHHHLKGNRTRKISGDSRAFDQALTQYLNAKSPSVADAYRYYQDCILMINNDGSTSNIPMVSYAAFNNRIKSFLRSHSN